MRELKMYKKNEKILVSGLSGYSNFEDLSNFLIYKFTNQNSIIRNKLEKEYIYSIEFDEEAKRIYIVLDGVKYFISLDEKEIRNFKLGQYNDITYELKRLLLAFNKRKEIEEKKYVLESKKLLEEKKRK